MYIYKLRYLGVDLGSRGRLYHRAHDQNLKNPQKVKKWKKWKKTKINKIFIFSKTFKKCSLGILLASYCSEIVFLDWFCSKMYLCIVIVFIFLTYYHRYPLGSDLQIVRLWELPQHPLKLGHPRYIFEQNRSKNTISEQYEASRMPREHFLKVFEKI